MAMIMERRPGAATKKQRASLQRRVRVDCGRGGGGGAVSVCACTLQYV